MAVVSITILVPVDGTDHSLEALETALELAGRLDTNLDVVNETIDATGRDAEPRILIEDGASGTGISTAVGERIVDAIAEGDYEFVVMGQHGDRATIDRALLGSASEVVLEEASIPVMLV